MALIVIFQRNDTSNFCKYGGTVRMSIAENIELTWDICICRCPKYKHNFDSHLMYCFDCKCKGYEFLTEMTDSDCKKYFRDLNTTVDLREFYGSLTGDVTTMQCFICMHIFADKEKVLTHLRKHKDREFLDSL